MPIQSVSSTPVTPILTKNSTITPVHSDAHIIGKAAATKSNDFSTTDIYIRQSNGLEGAVLGMFNAYVDTKSAMDRQMNGQVVTDYGNVGASVKRAVIQRAVTSTVRNGWSAFRGKATLAEAGGRVVGDVATSAVSSGVSSVANNVAVFALAKAGASSFPVMVGGMLVGWGASYASQKVMQKTGAQAAIINKTTELLHSAGVSNN
ncbi:hypothetical protein COW36_20580 [bacterium (Candidatus Blackallbacteria) CG17_big_fil_post_rev_8_21_14_2_50_48_46]|uniref:Uncharacterized protein n=1 Tax=bacterium (Candidatus Blackallbacteria) CG17_big_fil_post_rev_8_21_14_2_50_48_46 TaxID=2014261 RepID=A0A2M7G0P2_9BACT|nr:MAG: hypothetical protein COW64_22905 [bacterium (Candidatus Blackallbacteria) CG18_big_fil_WC_8_21_14_2_50_49_26]PIW14802.1 MAG: hypothetical protein COW36_20580 [bacterium (Candidatus Blackallbacteria) CG17_big_fil_post_rev_8_21_14_2_50_48_46]PIW50904.1 MAG: hypothetical protein COW20_01395 [bacterium (Candidatus Blackallbacteria) CG13_big_fil_rev_8_21_14_2_50_49_14]